MITEPNNTVVIWLGRNSGDRRLRARAIIIPGGAWFQGHYPCKVQENFKRANFSRVNFRRSEYNYTVRNFPPLTSGGIKHSICIMSYQIFEISWTGSRRQFEILFIPCFRVSKDNSWDELDVYGILEQDICRVCISDWSYILLPMQSLWMREK